MFVLAALATTVAARVEVEPVEGWREPLNVFVAVAMEPGQRKSAVYRDVMGPIVARERLLVENSRPAIAMKATIRRIAEAALTKAEKTAASVASREERRALEAQALLCAAELEQLDVPVEPRLFTADVTPEKLASLLHANGGRMAVLSAEGGIFDIIAGRYSSGIPNLDVYLAGHAGDVIRVDRVGRPTDYVDKPALTVGLAVQPYVLAKAAGIADFSGRGLLDRFMYAVPLGNVGFRRTDSPPVPGRVRQRYEAGFRDLAASPQPVSKTVTLHFDPEAAKVFADWRAAIEPRRRPGADLGSIQGWSSKLDGGLVRVAGLLHMAATIETGWQAPITVDTLSAAIAVGQYLIAHAFAAFDRMGACRPTARVCPPHRALDC